MAFAIDGEFARLEGALLIAGSAVALVGLARTGRDLLAGESGERVRAPGVQLTAGLGVLTAGGWLLGKRLRTTVRAVARDR